MIKHIISIFAALFLEQTMSAPVGFNRIPSNSSIILTMRRRSWNVMGKQYPFQPSKIELYQKSNTDAEEIEKGIKTTKDLPPLKVVVIENVEAIDYDLNDDGIAICNTNSWATPILLGINKGDRVQIKFPTDLGITKLERYIPAKTLNPTKWNKSMPSLFERASYEGTLLCVKAGEPVQLIDNWPVVIPEFEHISFTRLAKVRSIRVTDAGKGSALVHMILQIRVDTGLPQITRPPQRFIPFNAVIKDCTPILAHKLNSLVLGTMCKLTRDVTPTSKDLNVILHCEDFDLWASEMKDMAQAGKQVAQKMAAATGILGSLAIAIPAASIFTGWGLERWLKPTAHGRKIGIPTIKFDFLTIFRALKIFGIIALAFGTLLTIVYLLADGRQLIKNTQKFKSDLVKVKQEYRALLQKQNKYAESDDTVKALILLGRNMGLTDPIAIEGQHIAHQAQEQEGYVLPDDSIEEEEEIITMDEFEADDAEEKEIEKDEGNLRIDSKPDENAENPIDKQEGDATIDETPDGSPAKSMEHDGPVYGDDSSEVYEDGRSDSTSLSGQHDSDE